MAREVAFGPFRPGLLLQMAPMTHLQKAYTRISAILDGATDREALDLPPNALASPVDRTALPEDTPIYRTAA